MQYGTENRISCLYYSGSKPVKNSTRSILPALLAVSGGLTSTPANAIEIGEVNVASKLGQPLRASISYALGPNEYIADYCVSLSPRFATSGLPAITQAKVSVANGIIALTGKTAIREPLMAMRLDIKCPYTPNISREYMLFVDPARPAETQQAPVQRAVAAATPAVVATASAPQTSARRLAPRVKLAPIDNSERYRVQVGDSLSEIAQRIENRSVGLWSAVEQIFAANPDAFINNDPNRLKAGSWLAIPSFGPQAGFAAESSELPDTGAVYDAAFAAADTGAETAPPVVEVSASLAEAEATIEADDTSVLQPADVILDTELEAPITATNPNVPSASIIIADDATESSVNWLLWLIGSGIALIAGLLVFGRRGRSPSAPATVQPQRRSTDGNTEKLVKVPQDGSVIEDDSPTHENLVLSADVELDADLEIGTGLQQGTDVDVAQDFGFAVNTHLDLELPAESENPVEVDSSSQTDIIAPPQIDESSILDSEVMPEEDDYDMSVIMDATKMPMPEDVTERDLKAVVVENRDATIISGNYTLSREVDYDVLEQDYQDEMTATQALNIEIEKAAAEIAERMDDDDDNAADKTTQLPLATVTELDVTANLQVGKDSNDDTGVNPELTEEMIADDKTVEMPAKDDSKTG